MQIAFLTLFLGLASGRMPVEIAVTGAAALRAMPAAAVTEIELTLDGVPLRPLAGPPFKGEIDLGSDLMPHHLEAHGFDAEDREVARAEQWLNLPQPAATVDLIPELGPGGRIAAVRLAFRSVTFEKAATVTATLDGQPLPTLPTLPAGRADSERVTLPAYSPDLPHLLSIEVQSPSGLAAHRDLAFGGSLGTEVSTELTAVVVRTRSPLPAAAELRGWFVAAGRELRPTAIESGPGEILVVQSPNALKALQDLAWQGSERGRHGDAQRPSGMALGKDDRLRFVDPTANGFSAPGVTSAVFGVSAEFDRGKGGLFWQLSHLVSQAAGGPPLFADAVAIAGLQALTDQRRRAVLLVFGGETADGSRYDPATVRRYLEAIRVPLYVWSLRRPPYPAVVSAWGEVEEVSSLDLMRRAYARLRADLAAQRIVWLDGRHLPQTIALSSQVPAGVELAQRQAGRPTPP